MSPKLLNILLLTISVVLYYYVVNPLYSGTESLLFSSGQSITNLKKELDTYNKTIVAVPNLIAQANSDKALYDTIPEEDRKKILIMVPVAVNDIKLMSELTNIGVESGVPLDEMGIKDKGNGEYLVSFTITTTYTSFKKVMEYWEKSMRLFRLQTVAFDPGKTEEDVIKFSVELSTYYMK